MATLEKLRTNYQIGIGLSPRQSDVSFVSVNDSGTIGDLNAYVLKELDYSVDDLPNASELEPGFHGLFGKDKKPIIFIVTIDGKKSTEQNLRTNLLRALTEFRGLLSNKKVWFPLMGTGEGNLPLEESYKITVETINSFLATNPVETLVMLSFPDNPDGKDLLRETQTETEHSLIEETDQDDKNYFVAGSIWYGTDEQAQRFFENNIWENGYEGKYIELVKTIRPGDVIFLKSSFAQNEKSYLRLKGVGVVTKNHMTGIELDIDWILKNLNIDISGLGKYRSTIAKVNRNDVATLVNAAGLSDLLKIQQGTEQSSESKKQEVDKNSLLKINRSTIAELVSDGIASKDHLDVQKDIRAFSKIIASKNFIPPLAIALFGKWGSGKSFFMNRLKNQIEILSNNDRANLYCKGIAQIHFNAWSYLDANLWASIVTKIFEGLNEYITKDSKANVVKKEIEKELSQKLTVTKEEIVDLEKQKEAIEQQLTSLNKQRDEIENRLESDINKIKSSSIRDVLQRVDKEFQAVNRIKASVNANPTWQITEAELKEIIPQKYWENPHAAYQQMRSKYTFLKEFFRRDKIERNVIGLTLTLLLILVAPLIIIALTDYANKFDFLIPQTGLSLLITVAAVWKRAEVVYQKLQPVIASFWEIKENYQTQIDEAIATFEQNEKALRLEIDKRKTELVVINQQIQLAEVNKADLEFRIKNALATEALYSFIEKRSNSDDYKKHLGIVSIIRKDFEILSSLFLEHKKEDKDSEIFRKKFECPLERIILYIDDLDRCPEDRVVEVLEAVNLLMAFPLFIVIVGVDPRWIQNALIKKYQLQFGGAINREANLEALESIEASDYLEKIFQVPFHLKEANVESVKYMLKTLIAPRKDSKEKSSIEEPENSITNAVDSNGVKTMTTYSAEEAIHQNTETPHRSMEESEYLNITEEETELVQEFAPIIGKNPRAIKRFVNVYQIVRAHEDLRYFGQDEEKEFAVLMFLLSLPIGPFKKLTDSFRRYIDDSAKQDKPLSTFFGQDHQIEGLNGLKDELNVVMSGENIFDILQREQIVTFFNHNKFIQRFTFEQF